MFTSQLFDRLIIAEPTVAEGDASLRFAVFLLPETEEVKVEVEVEVEVSVDMHHTG
jgi:hypothetical protein